MSFGNISDTTRLNFIEKYGVSIRPESEEVGEPGEKTRVRMFRAFCNGTAGPPRKEVRDCIDALIDVEFEKRLNAFLKEL